MKLSIMQPSFIPWMGYFQLIAAADRFVLLDDAQVSFQSWNDRNRIFLAKEKVGWINAPLKKGGNFQNKFNEMPLNLNDRAWRKLPKTIPQMYGKTPYYKELSGFVLGWLAGSYESLAELNSAFIKPTAELLGLRVEWLDSSGLDAPGHRSERVLNIIRATEAEVYYSARGSFGYMAEDSLFPQAGIEVLFQNYDPPPYEQYHSPEFVSHLSILDPLFNIGPQRTADLIMPGPGAFQSWAEMVESARGTEEA